MDAEFQSASATEGVTPDVPEPIEGEVFEIRKDDEAHEDDEPRG